MKNHNIQKLIYELVSKLFVLPIYKFVFKGHLIGRDNIPQKESLCGIFSLPIKWPLNNNL